MAEICCLALSGIAACHAPELIPECLSQYISARASKAINACKACKNIINQCEVLPFMRLTQSEAALKLS